MINQNDQGACKVAEIALIDNSLQERFLKIIKGMSK